LLVAGIKNCVIATNENVTKDPYLPIAGVVVEGLKTEIAQHVAVA
jgi:hypothetical protein